MTEIDGLDINALPLIVTHGWPGSIIEQMKIIDPLTNPTVRGASASDAFHLVIPSMPGYGFSGRPATTAVGLAAYLLDRDERSLAHISELFVDGRPFGDLTRDDILDNITLTRLTNTAISSGRLYWERTVPFFQCQRRLRPGCPERLPGRALPNSA